MLVCLPPFASRRQHLHLFKKKQEQKQTLTGVAQLVECCKVAGSIPEKGSCLICRLGSVWEATALLSPIGVSLPLSLPSPLSKNK